MSTTQGAFRRSLLPRSIVLASAIVVSTGFLPAVPASAQSLPSIGQLGGSLPSIGDLLGGSTNQSERQLSVTPAVAPRLGSSLPPAPKSDWKERRSWREKVKNKTPQRL